MSVLWALPVVLLGAGAAAAAVMVRAALVEAAALRIAASSLGDLRSSVGATGERAAAAARHRDEVSQRWVATASPPAAAPRHDR